MIARCAFERLESSPFDSPSTHRPDATATDDRDAFWAINYRWGDNHREVDHDRPVERLVELRYRGSEIERTGRSLSLRVRAEGRNWESMARGRPCGGFWMATDRVPRTLPGDVEAK